MVQSLAKTHFSKVAKLSLILVSLALTGCTTSYPPAYIPHNDGSVKPEKSLEEYEEIIRQIRVETQGICNLYGTQTIFCNWAEVNEQHVKAAFLDNTILRLPYNTPFVKKASNIVNEGCGNLYPISQVHGDFAFENYQQDPSWYDSEAKRCGDATEEAERIFLKGLGFGL